MKRKIQWFVFLFAFAAAGHYLIEAESFPETGKWVSGNAGAASGQKFLTAGEKEARAQGDYAFPETGSYYVWVRNLSFSQNWRKCTVAVDGVSSSAVGDEATTLDTPAWIWSRSKKPFYLVKGIHRVTLTATSAAVRTDCILFTTDKEYVPAEGKAPAAGEYGVLLPEGVLRGKLVLDVATDKDALSYRCGEKVTFSLSAKLDGKRLPRGRVVYRLRDDAGTDQTGKFDLGQEGDEVFLETALDRPGFIRLTAELVDEKGRKMRGIDDRGEVSFGHFDGGAGVEPERIPSNPAPDDFDAFWAKQKARLAAVPLRADVKLLDRYSDAEFQTFAVTVDCAGARPATGFLIVPVGAAAGALAAEIHFEGYGTGIPAVPGRERRRDDALVFFVNAHGTPLQASPEQYAAFFSARKDYALTDNADAGRCYFNGMVLRVLRGCEYLASRPEWNRRDLEVVGGSQGGLQALWAAALDANVSHCAVEVPWNCNMAGRTFGLMAPDWGIAQYEPALEYYDPVHFAGHIRCPVVISRAGMGDYICPPSGVARMYFNLKCPKKITWIQNSDHGFAPPGAARWTFQEP